MRKALLFAATFTSMTALLMLTLTFGMAQGKDQILKIGKNGSIKLKEATKVGDLTLKPGPYQIQHRVNGSDHFIHFIELAKPLPGRVDAGGPNSHPGEVMCKIEPLNKMVTETAIYMTKEDGMMRITKIEISGENVAHVF